jgi:hypothetical protein
MKSTFSLTALGVTLLAGTSLAQAQTVETVVTPAPAAVQTVPVETVETVRTVRTPRSAREVTTTRTTTIGQGVVTAPAAPVIAAAPAYGGLYDVATTPAPAVAPVMPTYRYVYEPDRILVIDPYTNITIQALPR